MDPEIAIELIEVSKTFKVEVRDPSRESSIFNKYPTKTVENKVLDNFSFKVKKGEMVGIIGLNGSGKSTLLSIMARIMEPDSGSVRISGKVASILELGMGFHSDLSGRENIYIKGEMYGFTKKQIDERIDEIIDFSGLREYIDSPLRTYSSGMSGRLAFSIMINVDAEVMLLDEIMSTGDSSFTSKASVRFKKLLQSGKTVVFASQTLDQIQQMCTRAIWIDKGKIVADGPVKSVCSMFQNSISESLSVITDFANSGVAESQYRLALMYRDGQKVEKDESLHRSWMRRAAEQGHVLAEVAYADMLMSDGTDDARAEALVYYQSAALKGNSDARTKYSALVSGGSGSRDLEEVRSIMRQLAEIGHPSHKYQYASMMLRTALNNEDKKTAFEWFGRAADDGNPDAMLQMAYMYRDGIAVPRDNEKYIECLRKGADIGQPDCIKTLADIYLVGKITLKDEAKAFELYLRSAKLGNASAMYQVASMYRDGIGTDKDMEESDAWFGIYSNSGLSNYQFTIFEQMKTFLLDTVSSPENILSKAAASYNQRAISTLASMYRGDMSESPDVQKARQMYELAASWPGGPRLTLADLYYKGLVFEQDFAKAAELYRNLTYTCDAAVDYRLYLMYRDGLGFEKDAERGMFFLKRSARRGNQEAQRELRLIESRKGSL